MKKIKLFAVLGLIIICVSCNNILDIQDKPIATEKSVDFKVLLKDKTGSMMKIYGDDVVSNVEVILKSISLGTKYVVMSDENGVVTLPDVISDIYLVSAIRYMTEDEMEILTGERRDFYKLMNSGLGVVDLSADSKDTAEVYLDNLLLESPLVISEIYACGPPGSGLYFHDKYVEIFNQSDSTIYLDGLIIADVWSNPSIGINFIDDPEYIHTKRVWKFPGNGKDNPIEPQQFVVCAEDAIDHRVNAPNSINLSSVSFEFYKDDAPDIDNPNVPNMIKIHSPSTEVDWLIGGRRGALVIVQMDEDSIKTYDNHFLIPYKNILDGAEYVADLTDYDYKIMNPRIDAGFTGGISFYTGKSMERIPVLRNGKYILKDDDNSSLDFKVIDHPTPEFHYEIGN